MFSAGTIFNKLSETYGFNPKEQAEKEKINQQITIEK